MPEHPGESLSRHKSKAENARSRRHDNQSIRDFKDSKSRVITHHYRT